MPQKREKETVGKKTQIPAKAKRHHKDESERKVKSIPVRMTPPLHEQYSQLSNETGVSMSEPARRGLEWWFKTGGQMPPRGQIPIYGLIRDGDACEIRPLEPPHWVEPPSHVTWKAGDYALMLIDPLSERIKDAFGRNDNGVFALCPSECMTGFVLGLFRPTQSPLGQIAHLERQRRDGDHEVMLRHVRQDEKGRTYILEPGHEKVSKGQVEVRGVLRECWQVGGEKANDDRGGTTNGNAGG